MICHKHPNQMLQIQLATAHPDSRPTTQYPGILIDCMQNQYVQLGKLQTPPLISQRVPLSSYINHWQAGPKRLVRTYVKYSASGSMDTRRNFSTVPLPAKCFRLNYPSSSVIHVSQPPVLINRPAYRFTDRRLVPWLTLECLLVERLRQCIVSFHLVCSNSSLDLTLLLAPAF